MKLNDILSNNFQAAEWEAKGYELPKYDIAAVAKKLKLFSSCVLLLLIPQHRINDQSKS